MRKRGWLLIDSATTPDGDGLIELIQKGREFVICVDRRELMGSYAHRSEDVLAELSVAKFAPTRPPRVLVGGLGMGFTLASALKATDASSEVVVAELVPEVVQWNRDRLADIAGRPLEDPRCRVHTGDVCALLESAHESWDIILLDVDNGPRSLTKPENGWLYTNQGLAAAHRSLRPGGVLGVWSARPNRAFARRMAAAGFVVDELEVEPRLGAPQRHVIWTGVRE
jgi:spermidine synthase